MIQMILAGAIALVFGAAAGTAIGVMKAPPPPAVAKGADSAAVAMSTHGPAGTTAPEAAKRATPVTAVPVSAAGPMIGPAPAPPAPPATPAVIPTATADLPLVKLRPGSTETLSYRQVARILSNMNPQDAVKILGYLQDEHVEGILGELGVRQAAGLLAQLPTERAARLSERLMHHPPTETR
jgi:hypothetical protein